MKIFKKQIDGVELFLWFVVVCVVLSMGSCAINQMAEATAAIKGAFHG